MTVIISEYLVCTIDRRLLVYINNAKHPSPCEIWSSLLPEMFESKLIGVFFDGPQSGCVIHLFAHRTLMYRVFFNEMVLLLACHTWHSLTVILLEYGLNQMFLRRSRS